MDIGASGLGISGSVAQLLGLKRGRPFDVQTANGTARVSTTRLDSLAIGRVTQRDVRAHINPSMNGDTALPGMEFLRHYNRMQRDGELTISSP